LTIHQNLCVGLAMQRNRSQVQSGPRPEALHAEQVRSAYTNLPLTLAVSAVNAGLVGFVFGPTTTVETLQFWLFPVLVLIAARALTWMAYRRFGKGDHAGTVWWMLATAGSFAAGTLWGSMPWVFAPLDAPHLMFAALVIAGMCAGAATVHAPHGPTAIAFILPACLSLATAFFAQGGRLAVAVGLMICVFAITLCAVVFRFRNWFDTLTATRLTLVEQTEALRDANRRLLAEVESHRSTTAKLQQAQKLEAIGRLTAGIAHDFNNVLMVAGGAADMGMRHLAEGSPAAPFVATIQAAVGRAARLTQHLLAFGRVQALQPRALNANEVLDGMSDLLTTTLGGLATLVVDRHPVPVVALVDRSQLEQAVLNLVINARDAMPDGGVITIRTGLGARPDGAASHVADRFVSIAVSDTGRGMTEEDRQRAFDPFFTTKEIGKGSGLGLSQVYGLAKQSGGVAHIESKPDAGTTVSIWLPQVAAEPPVAATTDRGTPVHSPEGARVLLLDDDPGVRKAVAAMLVAAGYTVTSHGSGAEALAELEGPGPITLLVVDYAMPAMRGDAFAARARRLRADVPILFITGYADVDALDSERWILRKPFRIGDLTRMAAQAIRLPAGTSAEHRVSAGSRS
jgi:signal transduction histidine kinase/CheY-like chemotaxis protein